MRAGAWHQCCHNSQNLVEEQLSNGVGVGAILSPKDVSEKNLRACAKNYKAAGGKVLVDQQFYVPEFSNKNLETYTISKYRPDVTNFSSISDANLDMLARELFTMHQTIQADGIVSPALAYEAGRNDITQFNARLFRIAKKTGDALGVPTYATVVIGSSATAADATVNTIISQATSLDCDGFYFAFDFGAAERIPTNKSQVLRALNAGLTLTCTGKPVLHAFAGPMGLLSFAYGAKGATIGHFQNVWQFDRSRWGTTDGGGGGGNAPARFFSSALWGTIVYPDEVELLNPDNRKSVVTSSSFSTPVAKPGGLPWQKWDSNKHLVATIGKRYDELATIGSARKASTSILQTLKSAVDLHKKISAQRIQLKDATDSYQAAWHDAIATLLKQRSDDFDYLEMIS